MFLPHNEAIDRLVCIMLHMLLDRVLYSFGNFNDCRLSEPHSSDPLSRGHQGKEGRETILVVYDRLHLAFWQAVQPVS